MPRVLLIDDEGATRRLARRMLELSGHEVGEAADGDEGLRAYGARPADVVLCDLRMPGRGGLEAIPELTRQGARVVAVSGSGAEALSAARAAGACGALAKPFGRRDLLDAIELALARF